MDGARQRPYVYVVGRSVNHELKQRPYVYVVDEPVVEGDLGDGGGDLGPPQFVLTVKLQRCPLLHSNELPSETLHVEIPAPRCIARGQQGWKG